MKTAQILVQCLLLDWSTPFGNRQWYNVTSTRLKALCSEERYCESHVAIDKTNVHVSAIEMIWQGEAPWGDTPEALWA